MFNVEEFISNHVMVTKGMAFIGMEVLVNIDGGEFNFVEGTIVEVVKKNNRDLVSIKLKEQVIGIEDSTVKRGLKSKEYYESTPFSISKGPVPYIEGEQSEVYLIPTGAQPEVSVEIEINNTVAKPLGIRVQADVVSIKEEIENDLKALGDTEEWFVNVNYSCSISDNMLIKDCITVTIAPYSSNGAKLGEYKFEFSSCEAIFLKEICEAMYKVALNSDDAEKILLNTKVTMTGGCMTASEMGKKGGSAKTEAKANAAKENGKKGGRPRKAE